MPSFVYLRRWCSSSGSAPRPRSSATLIYALPPVVRIAAHGIRNVSADHDRGDRLARVRRRGSGCARCSCRWPAATIIVGRQPDHHGRAVDGHHRGVRSTAPASASRCWRRCSASTSAARSCAGLPIVLMAIMLDRTTTAASQRAEMAPGGGEQRRRAGSCLGVARCRRPGGDLPLAPTLWAAEFPETSCRHRARRRGRRPRRPGSSTPSTASPPASRTSSRNVLLNPLQDLLADSPWWLVAVAILASRACSAAGVRRRRRHLPGRHLATRALERLDDHADDVLVATVVVMVLAVVLGVWMGRSRRGRPVLRPILDAGQTMPPFVYLIPVLALFGSTRFTAIIAGVVYAAPVAIKLVADGIRGVSPTHRRGRGRPADARWQMISKVQLPMARGSLVLAANQGLLYVLSMVVDRRPGRRRRLGLRRRAGFRASELCGKGAGRRLAIVLLGIMLDRITQAAARTQPAKASGDRHAARCGQIASNPTGDGTRTRGSMRSRAAAWLRPPRARLVLAACGSGGGRSRDETKANESKAAAGGTAATSTWPSTPGLATRRTRTWSASSPTKKLGCKVNYKDLKEEVSWQGFGTGEVDVVTRELGSRGTGEEVHRRPEGDASRTSGRTGNVGVIGWYVPPWLATSTPTSSTGTT